MKAVLSLSFLFFAPLQCFAAECVFHNNYQHTSCVAKELKKAKIDLDYAYQRSLDAIKADRDRSEADKASRRTNLIGAQKAWIAYKEAQCNGVVADRWAGGSGMAQAVLSCELAHARIRTKELEHGSE